MCMACDKLPALESSSLSGHLDLDLDHNPVTSTPGKSFPKGIAKEDFLPRENVPKGNTKVNFLPGKLSPKGITKGNSSPGIFPKGNAKETPLPGKIFA